MLVIEILAFASQKAPGFESYVFSLLDGLYAYRDKIKYDKIVIALCAGQEQYFQKYTDKFEIFTVKTGNIISRMIALESIQKKLKMTKNDTIIFTAGYGGRKRRYAKSILVVHDLQYLHFPQYWSKFKLFHRKMYVPNSIKNADMIVAISDATKNDILLNFNKIDKNKINVAYHILDFSIFNDCSTDFCVKDKFFLCVSSSAPHKNLILLLKAFYRFVKKYPNYKLLLTAKAENLDVSAQKIVNEIKDNIVFSGYIKAGDLAYLYKNCEAFVLPTRFEGLGLPIVEAQYFNAPLILSDLPVCHEASGNKAIFFDVDNEGQLTDILEKVASRDITFDKNYTKVLSMFESENAIKKYITIINAV